MEIAYPWVRVIQVLWRVAMGVQQHGLLGCTPTGYFVLLLWTFWEHK